MSTPSIEMAYPLRWPEGRRRETAQKSALFRDKGSALTLTVARKRLRDQVESMTRRGQSWRMSSMVLSINIRFTASSGRDQNLSRRDPLDSGAAFYFNLDGRPHVLACDRWVTVADNIAAIAAHIEALRGQERWGVADMRQAFAGHVALPAPEQWWQVLGLTASASLAEIDAAWRELSKAAHPDNQETGSNAAMARLNAARVAGKASRA